MASTMHVDVVSAEKNVLSADVTELYARSVEGEIGILPGHQPALIALDIGLVRLKLVDGEEERIAVHHGVLYVEQGGKVIVLADIAERSSEVDVERARVRAAEVERLLADGDDAALRASLRKQQLRLQVADSA